MKKTYIFIVQFLLFILHIPTTIKACLAKTVLQKKYNEVAFPATHNGHSHAESIVQNQSLSLSDQLQKGIRATKIHVYPYQEGSGPTMPYVCHGVGKEIVAGNYFDKVLEKVPRLFKGWVEDILKHMAPINEIVRDACAVAYGEGTKQGAIPFKHCILDPSRRTLVTLLSEIRKFLEANRQEIFTLIVEDHTKDLDRLAQDFVKANLDTYVHVQDTAKEWPTIGSMINQGKRLVVLVHGDENLCYKKYPWMHYIWDYAWDTEWDFQESDHLKDILKDCMPKRGIQTYAARNNGPKNKLFIVHHFVTPLTGGSKNEAKKVNKKSFLQSRLERLAKKAGHIPNIIQVDFFDQPGNDVFEVVSALNK